MHLGGFMPDRGVQVLFLIALLIVPFVLPQPALTGEGFSDINPSRYWLFNTTVSEIPPQDSLPVVNAGTLHETIAVTPEPAIESGQVTLAQDVVQGSSTSSVQASGSGIGASYAGMGRGSVSTGFSVRIDSPSMHVDNRESYKASGLFDLHAVHSFA